MKKLLVMCMAMMAMGFAACSEDIESKQIENAVKALVSQYPEATLQDVYKSFYQERFGPGHMIPNVENARNYLMSEMELMCDRVGIISEGRMIGTYTMDEIKSRSEGEKASYIIETDNAAQALKALDIYTDAAADGTKLSIELDTETAREEIAKIIKKLSAADINIYSVVCQENKKLEDVFIELTSKEGDGQIA